LHREILLSWKFDRETNRLRIEFKIIQLRPDRHRRTRPKHQVFVALVVDLEHEQPSDFSQADIREGQNLDAHQLGVINRE